MHVKLKKFNVIVGPNGAGKTNFVEVFKFIRTALLATGRPYIPYLDWWSHQNIVWNGKDNLPIKVKITCVINELNVEYEFSVGWVDGASRILSEKLVIKELVTITREGSIIQVKHDSSFLETNRLEIQKTLEDFNKFLTNLGGSEEKRKLTLDSLRDQSYKTPVELNNLLQLYSIRFPVARTSHEFASEVITTSLVPSSVTIGPVVVSPFRAKDETNMFAGLITATMSELRDGMGRFTILTHPDIRQLKAPAFINQTFGLFENASNLVAVLYSWFAQKRRLPERIETTVSELFPDTVIDFGFTSDGRVFLKMNEKGVEFNPPGIPDGLYKLLAILVAIELNSSVLAIDEIENSLYKKALEYAIDELRESRATVIITTHSPLVVDMVRLEDLLITEKTTEGTIMNRIKSPEDVRRKLAELKITQSESWLFEGLKHQ